MFASFDDGVQELANFAGLWMPKLFGRIPLDWGLAADLKEIKNSVDFVGIVEEVFIVGF